jgi:NADPH-dependent curcumin reductase CurA
LDFLSLLGFTGLTAYFGLLDICDPKPGETVVVSGAAGAVGMVAAQIAKLKGSRVIGVAGGAEKCRYLKEELGLDEVVDYKSDNFKASLAKATPKYINAYFDNGMARWKLYTNYVVGGTVLEECLGRAAPHARYWHLCRSI